MKAQTDGFPEKETEILIPGPAGQLQCRWQASQVKPNRGVGVVCHPHPLHAGTMQNKVVTTVFKAMLESGFHAIRFNYRGVGKSEGEYDNAMGETEDALTVIQFIQSQFPSPQPLAIAGFSFGAYVATKAALNEDALPIKHIALAPAVAHAPFEELPPLTFPSLFIIPEADEVVSVAATDAWLANRDEPIEIVRFADTSHFFHGQLVPLRETVKQFLSS